MALEPCLGQSYLERSLDRASMHDPHPHGAQSLDGAGVILDIGAEYRIQCNSAAMRCVALNEIPLNDR